MYEWASNGEDIPSKATSFRIESSPNSYSRNETLVNVALTKRVPETSIISNKATKHQSIVANRNRIQFRQVSEI